MSQLKSSVIEAALATKGISKSLPGYPQILDSWLSLDGDDIFIKLSTNTIRVEVSALPAEFVERGLMETPIPDHTTLKSPEPISLTKRGRPKKK